jgi:uncharacterized protein YqeY
VEIKKTRRISSSFEKIKMILEEIKKDLNEAIKNKDQEKIRPLRYVLSILYNYQIEKKAKLRKEGKDEKTIEKEGELNDDEVVNLIASEIKKRKEAVLEFKKGGREDLIEKEEKEIEILKKYLPRQLTEEELRDLIKTKIKEYEAEIEVDRGNINQVVGKVMSKIMPEIKGRADGNMVKEFVKEEIEKLNNEGT